MINCWLEQLQPDLGFRGFQSTKCMCRVRRKVRSRDSLVNSKVKFKVNLNLLSYKNSKEQFKMSLIRMVEG